MSSSVTAICGGLGGARFALALEAADHAAHTTFVTNVADDWVVDGLYVCPDTDAVLYALQGRFDEERGWGLRGDQFPVAGTGETTWFSLGATDRAHHERRTQLMASGRTLSEAVAAIATETGVTSRLLPASDGPRGTVIVTSEGPRAFQEWLVRDHAQPQPLDVQWPENNQPAPGVLDALNSADIVVLTSSSPVASLEPTLTLDGVRDRLRARREAGRPVVLLSPVVSGSSPRTDRDRRRHHARSALLAARGVDHTPEAVASYFSDLATHVVLDPADAALADRMPDGLTVLVGPILDQSPAARIRLVEACLHAASAVGC